MELNKLEEAEMLHSEVVGNKKYFFANKEHPLFNDVKSIVHKYIGLDKIIEEVVERLGDVKQVYLTGDWAKGKESEVIDICIVGSNLDRHYLLELIDKTERIIGKKIKYLIYEEKMTNTDGALLLWNE